MINNITGPGVPALPNLFVESGWLMPFVAIVLVWLMTSLSSSMYCEAMRKIPGNEHFSGRIEYTSIVTYYFGRKTYIASQIGLNGALQSLNIASVIQSATVMDNAISAVFGKSCGINFLPWNNFLVEDDGQTHNIAGSADFFSCLDTSDLSMGNPWGCHIVLTAGFVLTAAMAIPCGQWNLDDNMNIQIVAFILTLICWGIWICAAIATTDSISLPAVNNDPQTGSQAGVLGAVLFNFGFVTTVPSWVNEKRSGVSVNRTLWTSTTACIIIFFAVGISGAIAFPDVLQGPTTNTCARQLEHQAFNCRNDLLQVFTNSATMPAALKDSPIVAAMLRGSAYLFPIVAVVSGIPIFSIVIKYNMIENGFSQRFGFLWGVIFPWAVALPLLYQPNVLAQFINLTSLIFVSFTDFIIPLALYVALQKMRYDGSTASDSQSFLTVTNANGDALGDGRAHYAMPRRLRLSIKVKAGIAIFLAAVLAVASVSAFVLAVAQTSFSWDRQTCALVGD